MAVRTIVKIPSAVLGRKSIKVKKFDEALERLVDDMVDTLYSTTGVGLAAPQIGIGEKVIVVEYGEENAEPEIYVVINPEIVEASEEMVTGIEGCLSVPDLIGEVERHERITVKGQDVHGKRVKIQAEGWLARIFQHEIDHLDGIIYTQRAGRVWRPGENEVYTDNV
jgi:peptide deformylase